jgi:hypothetical protein
MSVRASFCLAKGITNEIAQCSTWMSRALIILGEVKRNTNIEKESSLKRLRFYFTE